VNGLAQMNQFSFRKKQYCMSPADGLTHRFCNHLETDRTCGDGESFEHPENKPDKGYFKVSLNNRDVYTSGEIDKIGQYRIKKVAVIGDSNEAFAPHGSEILPAFNPESEESGAEGYKHVTNKKDG